MRYFLVVLILCVMAFSATFNGPAYSQRRTGYCDQAVSTADALDCVNRNNQNIQNKLSAMFKTLMEGQQEQNRALLSESQKDWILYRDAQCAWEASLTDTPSLKRVYELSCLTAMTDQRISLLETVRDREAQPEPREFSTQPRWMNALATDYPDIFWRYGEYKTADMDCDGEDEQIMTGISVAQIEQVTIDEKSATEKVRQDVELVIAISENPATGRPKATLLRLPVGQNQDVPHLCRPAINMELKDHPGNAVSKADSPESAGETATTDKAKMNGAVTSTEKPPSVCKTLQITDRSCAPVTVIWNGKDYSLQQVVAGKEEAL